MMLADALNEITVKDALAGVGLFDRPGEQAVLMTADPVRNVLASEYAERDVQEFSALYHASGLFRPYAIQKGGGRRQENLVRVVWLTLDCDLIDWLGAPKGHPERESGLARMWSAPQAEIDDEVGSLRRTLETVLGDLGLPLHRLDYTGYGVCGYIYLAEGDQARIDTARQVHKEIIARINEQAGVPLVDTSSSDAGTRVTRVPGSLNRKGEIARTVVSMLPYTGETWRLSLEAPKRAASAISSAIPSTGDGLGHDDVQKIVDAMAPHWSHGQKHDVALAFAGMLAKALIPEDQALAIVAHLASADEKPWDRANCVRTSYARARAGFTTAGYMKLKAIVPAAALDFIDGILTRFRMATGPRVTVGGETSGPTINAQPANKDTLDSLPIPESCLSGWLGEYVELMEPLSEAPTPFHLASGMALVGASIGRRICGRYVSKNLYANLYIMLVAMAGTGKKDTAIRFAVDLPTQTVPGRMDFNRPSWNLSTDIGSSEGLIRVLNEQANTLLWITEFQRLVRQAKRQATSTIFPVMTAAWDTPLKLENVTKGNPLTAKLPYLSVLAAVQPGILANEFSTEDIESGFATRWLYVVGSSDRSLPDPPDIDANRAFDLYRRLTKTIESYGGEAGQEARVDLDKAARERWVAWYEGDRHRVVVSEDEDSMRSRLGVHIRKIALVYAVSDGAHEIGLKHLEPAIDFVEWCWVNTRKLMRFWGVGIWKDIEIKIEAALAKKPMRRRDLERACHSRRWTGREFAQVLDAMIKNQTVVLDPDGVVMWSA